MVERTIYLDLETYSTVDIKKGVYRYAEGAEIMLYAYAIESEAPIVWDCTESPDMPGGLYDALHSRQYTLCAHNSQFDRVILERCSLPEHKHLYIGQVWRDTAVRALAHGLPAGLAALSGIYNLAESGKDSDGRRLIQLFCKPDKNGQRRTAETHFMEWAKFKRYAGQDIVAMRELDKRLPTWNDTAEERALWYLDQKINDRGFYVDTELATAAIEAVKTEQRTLDARTHSATGGSVSAATKRDAMLRHILDIYGVDLPDMQISTLTRRLEDPDLPDAVKELISLRLLSSGTATTKYKTLLNCVCKDNRLRGTLQFCSARTGRWGGRLFQPQNLPRPGHKAWEVEEGIEAIKSGAAVIVYDNVKDIASSAIRGAITATPGEKLVVSDLSAIEGRVLAWVADEAWKIKAYEDLDKGYGFDLYILTYARTFGVQPKGVTPAQRQLGKTLELAMGYAGGVGAFVTFSAATGIDLEQLATSTLPDLKRKSSAVVAEALNFWQYASERNEHHGLSQDVFVTCDTLKRLWRNANPAIVSAWAEVESAVRDVLSGSAPRSILRGVVVDRKGSWLRIRLPSGRYLSYPGAKLERGKIKYLGTNQYSKKWGYLTTYGGKLIENVVQAIARDILACGMIAAEKAGYSVVLSVHDELLTETPDEPEYNHTELSYIMSIKPQWALDLPLDAKGFEGYRYRKD